MNATTLRFAMLGMIPGNGHPYSWSAIINGYDPVAMADCPYPAIPAYLGAEPLETVRIYGTQVTHIWTDNPCEAPLVARASKIPNVVERMEDVIGHVDAVIVATDDGTDHVRRARPFVEAGLPVFVDKPLATTREELAQFIAWRNKGARILSSSSMRYAPAFRPLRSQKWRWITFSGIKKWETYGIHGLEPIFTIVGPGFIDARAEKIDNAVVIQLRHQCGTLVTIAILDEAAKSFGAMHAYGATEHRAVASNDTYLSFRTQLVNVIDWVRTGVEPFPFSHTIELMAVIIAGSESLAAGGNPVAVAPIIDAVRQMAEAL